MLHLLKLYIPRGSAVLAATTVGSYALGLLRDRAFAQTFGASRALDAYNAAFLMPDFLFNFFVASGIAAAFIPVFIDLVKDNPKKANDYTNTILNAALGFTALLALLVIIFAYPASRLVAPGFAEADRTLLVRLLRLLALSPIIFAASNALGSLLVAKKRFLFYGLSPMLYNVGIIAGVYFLSPIYGIMGVAWGTVAGAVLHLAARIYDALRSGFRFQGILEIRTAEFRQTLRLMLPKMFGHPVELATYWIFTNLASHLAAGSIVSLNFARNFLGLGVSVIGIVVGTAVFPVLAAAASDRAAENFWRVFRRAFLLILIVSAVLAGGYLLFGQLLIQILLGGGAFDPDAIARTTAVLSVFALAIPSESLTHLLARTFYATKNTALPVAATLTGLVLAGSTAYTLMPQMGLSALPLAFVIGSGGKFLLLLILLPGRRKFFSRPQ